MKIAIIGAGPAGLAAGKHCLDVGYQIDIFEQTDKIGGTWVYTDNTGVDINGLPIHSSMYQGLRTNLPKELMEYEGFKYPSNKNLEPFITQEEVLEYIKNYAKCNDLEQYIKFLKYVIKVDPINKDKNRWLIEYEDVKSNIKYVNYYNAIFVCNGHYKDSFMPDIPGLNTFTGKYKHSHDYRIPDPYKDKIVLIIGAGPSGSDISRQISNVAKKVYISCNSKNLWSVPENVIQKPIVENICNGKITFNDGTRETIDEILFCTGYKYNFPFLTENCKIKIDDNWVHPLYKHVISIENPTMAFIGIPFATCPFPMFDIQVKFFLASLSGHFILPSKNEMLSDLNKEVILKKNMGVPIRHFHKIGTRQGQYFDDLAETANITKVPSEITKIYLALKMNQCLNKCQNICNR